MILLAFLLKNNKQHIKVILLVFVHPILSIPSKYNMHTQLLKRRYDGNKWMIDSVLQF